MRYLATFTLLFLAACANDDSKNQVLQAKIDQLQQQLDHAYKPGFGEFMSSIQVHHAKLWFAGKHQNWELADFEIQEIEEALDGIQQYDQDRPESKAVSRMDGSIVDLKKAIQLKDPEAFKQDFVQLTNTCNSCHVSTNHDYNVIKIPDQVPFTNQDFNAPRK